VWMRVIGVAQFDSGEIPGEIPAKGLSRGCVEKVRGEDRGMS
jgi:hypothetical protein